MDNSIKNSNSKADLYILYLCIVEDIGVKRFNEIQEKYFNNEFNVESEKDINRFIEIAINYES